jgi:hypothetical protein
VTASLKNHLRPPRPFLSTSKNIEGRIVPKRPTATPQYAAIIILFRDLRPYYSRAIINALAHLFLRPTVVLPPQAFMEIVYSLVALRGVDFLLGALKKGERDI